MSDHDNAQVACLMINAWNTRDLERYLALLSDDCIVQSSHEAPARGRDAAGKTMQRYLSALPDLWFDVTRVVATEDVAVVNWRALRAEGCTVVGLRHGRVVRLWHYDEPLLTERTSGVALAGIE